MSEHLTPEGEYTESEIPGEVVPEAPVVEGEYTDSELPESAEAPKDADEVDDVEIEVVEVEQVDIDPAAPADEGFLR